MSISQERTFDMVLKYSVIYINSLCKKVPMNYTNVLSYKISQSTGVQIYMTNMIHWEKSALKLNRTQLEYIQDYS